MAFVFLFILRNWLDMGILFRLRPESDMDQSRIPVWAVASYIWHRSYYGPVFHIACSGYFVFDFPGWNDKRNHFRVRCWSCHGADLPCALLGLQYNAVSFEWVYLPEKFSRLGMLFHCLGQSHPPADRETDPVHPEQGGGTSQLMPDDPVYG